jgi:hypothetical protein
MMAAEQQTMTPAAAEWTYRSHAERHRAVDMLLRDPLWSLLDDEAMASIAEVRPSVVRDHRRMVGKNNGSENTRDGGG